MKINENKITLVNGKKTVVYDILFSFEANNNKYYVYTNNEEDEDGFIKVYAGIYMKDSKKEYAKPKVQSKNVLDYYCENCYTDIPEGEYCPHCGNINIRKK